MKTMSKTQPSACVASKASTSKASTSKATIKILVLPDQNRPKRYTDPAPPKLITPMELENYVDPDPEIQKFLQDKTGLKGIYGKNGPTIKPREEWYKEENEKLREEVTKLREERDSIKKELRKAKGLLAKKKYVANKKLKQEAQRKEDAAAGIENARAFDTLHKTSQQRIIQRTWYRFVGEHGEENAKKIIRRVYDRYVPDEDIKRSLTAVETLNFMKNCSLNVLALRKIRHELIALDIYNPFASDRAVLIERKRRGEVPGGADERNSEDVEMEDQDESEASSNGGNTAEAATTSVNGQLNENVNNRIYSLSSNDNYEPIYYIRE